MKYLLACLFLTLGYCSQAQQSNEITIQGLNTQLDLPNEAIITQLGLTYSGTGSAGSNVALLQSGLDNQSMLNIIGSGNLITTQQVGNNNQLRLDLTGQNNKYDLLQDGNNNLLQLMNTTSSGIQFQVIQRGDGNELTRNGNGLGALPSLKIEQTGGMKLIIETTNFYVPQN
ncbi:hypothetical protein GCM10027275_06460 [Rhabdobacter roseus]|uniref:Curlin associated repeat-containing protein n=1 Tax=Rhabdobacter roseus TaxID=1655419 RepID=A0A840TLV8_9BACT|nr:hypothetical protein [Rhabdobacter roseus]MBB5282542.1 hypothetical protein [Rhabdobacter roseus]